MSPIRRIMVALVGLLVMGGAARAYDQPAVNLGLTSFLDGIPPAGPGWYVEDYVQFYTSDSFRDGDGDKLPFPDPQLDVWINVLQGIYLSEETCPLTGGAIGLNVILPYVDFDLDYAAAGPFPMAGDSGFGDLLVGPFLQWTEMGQNGPTFAHRIELQCIFPTGEYDEDAQLNPGANVFSFNPYWACTWFLGPDVTLSTRIHYLWNDKNDDPAARPGGVPDEVQAGQAVHANITAAYKASDELRLGANAYVFKQFEKTEVDGVDEDGSEEQVIGIGPGILYSFSKDTHLFLNAYFEMETESRQECERYNDRIVHHF